jgi:hypothetical protein
MRQRQDQQISSLLEFHFFPNWFFGLQWPFIASGKTQICQDLTKWRAGFFAQSAVAAIFFLLKTLVKRGVRLSACLFVSLEIYCVHSVGRESAKRKYEI